MFKKFSLFKFSKVLGYAILFNALIPFFLFAEISISKNVSPFDASNLFNLLIRYGYLLAVMLFANYKIFRFSPATPRFSKFYYLLSSLELVLILFSTSNKFFFIANGLWLIAIFYFYFLLSSEFNEAYFQSGMHPQDLHPRPVSVLECLVHNEAGVVYNGIVTNCSESGLYVTFTQLPMEIVGTKVRFTVNYLGRTFGGIGQVVSHSVYFQGIGIKYIEDKAHAEFDWKELIKILTNRKLNFGGLN